MARSRLPSERTLVLRLPPGVQPDAVHLNCSWPGEHRSGVSWHAPVDGALRHRITAQSGPAECRIILEIESTHTELTRRFELTGNEVVLPVTKPATLSH